MAFDANRAVASNRRWGAQLGWLPHSQAICEQVLSIGACEGTSADFARGVQSWQEGQVRLDDDGVIGPQTWRRIARRLRDTRTPLRAPAPAGAANLVCRNTFIFAPEHGSAGKPGDARGAFHPGARKFQAVHHTGEPFFFDNRAERSARRDAIFAALGAAPDGLEAIAYFGHGLTDQLSSAGIRTPDIGEFARIIRAKAAPRCKVLLYACSSGALGGFAEKLADELCGRQSRADRQMEVFGHTCSGHSFYNPFVTCFPEGALVVPARTRLFRQWREALRRADFWARFAFMSDEAMQAEIAGG